MTTRKTFAFVALSLVLAGTASAGLRCTVTEKNAPPGFQQVCITNCNNIDVPYILRTCGVDTPLFVPANGAACVAVASPNCCGAVPPGCPVYAINDPTGVILQCEVCNGV